MLSLSLRDSAPRIASLLSILFVPLALAVADTHNGSSEALFVWPPSVLPGDTLRVYGYSSRESVNLVFQRIDGRTERMKTVDHVHPVDAVHHLTTWSRTPFYTMRVPGWWRAGVYEACIPAEHDTQRYTFVVRNPVAGSTSRLAVVLAYNTWEAYNNFDGRSLYEFNSSDKPTGRVSLRRPYASGGEEHGGEHAQSFARWEQPFTAWLSREGIAAEYLMSIDLDANPDALAAYDALVFVGHHEYWTLAERRAVEAFEAAGKHVAIFGGNTCWWQARIENDDSELVCYRQPRKDPLFGHADSLVTCLWREYPVNRPENTLIGTSWANGGLVNEDTFLTKADGFGGYGAWNTHHWVFRDADVRDGEVFGRDEAIVGYEVDGAKFDWLEGIPTVSGVDSTPRSFQILGLSPALLEGLEIGRHHATMGAFQTPGGGWVFNASTTNWADGLAHDTTVQTITRNVIRRFLNGHFPPTVTSWSPYRVVTDTINHERSGVRSRTLAAYDGQWLPFAVSAIDPHRGDLQFQWSVDDVAMSEDSIFFWQASAAGNSPRRVALRVNNAWDTTTLEWSVWVTGVRILTRADRRLREPGEPYIYKAQAASDTGAVQFSLTNAPDWMSVSDEGIVTGLVGGDSAIYHATLIAVNARGEEDSEIIQVPVHIVLGARPGASAVLSPAIATYPNPFGQTMSMTVIPPSRGTMRVEVVTTAGTRVRTLFADGVHAGERVALQWDGNSDSGAPMPNGAYAVVVSSSRVNASPWRAQRLVVISR